MIMLAFPTAPVFLLESSHNIIFLAQSGAQFLSTWSLPEPKILGLVGL